MAEKHQPRLVKEIEGPSAVILDATYRERSGEEPPFIHPRKQAKIERVHPSRSPSRGRVGEGTVSLSSWGGTLLSIWGSAGRVPFGAPPVKASGLTPLNPDNQLATLGSSAAQRKSARAPYSQSCLEVEPNFKPNIHAHRTLRCL